MDDTGDILLEGDGPTFQPLTAEDGILTGVEPELEPERPQIIPITMPPREMQPADPVIPDGPLQRFVPSAHAWIRYEALHVFGVNDLSTRNVKAIFQWTPLSIEWINDASCNVVWADEVSALSIYEQLGRPLGDGDGASLPTAVAATSDGGAEEAQEQSGGLILPEDGQELMTGAGSDSEVGDRATSESAMAASTAATDGSIADLGMGDEEHPVVWKFMETAEEFREQTPGLYIRLATNEDRKARGSYKRSQYYSKHGRPTSIEERMCFTWEIPAEGGARVEKRRPRTEPASAGPGDDKADPAAAAAAKASEVFPSVSKSRGRGPVRFGMLSDDIAPGPRISKVERRIGSRKSALERIGSKLPVAQRLTMGDEDADSP